MNILRNKWIQRFIKVILPIIFINYFICISFFTHTHIVNGVTIVHSHPYQSDSRDNPGHEHTGAELQLIQYLSTFFTVAIIVFAVFMALVLTKCRLIVFFYNEIIPRQQNKFYPFLRPPPICE